MGGQGQVGFGPLERIDGPPPLRPLYGLLQSAEAPAAGVRIVPDESFDLPEADTLATARELGLPHPGEERWINGVEVYPYPPDLGDVYDPCASGSNQTTKGYGTATTHPQYGAMTVWLAETCTASRVWDQDEFKARAVATLSAVESAAVAHELMYGTRLGANPFFADGGGTFPLLNVATSARLALAALEDEIGKSGRAGLIHASPGVATILREQFALDNKTGVWRTVNGTVVVPDAGYTKGITPAQGPAGHPAPGLNQDWIYATGPIDVRRSEMFTTPNDVREALDRGVGATGGLPNSITYRVERYYLADWDKEVQSAVLVDRTL